MKFFKNQFLNPILFDALEKADFNDTESLLEEGELNFPEVSAQSLCTLYQTIQQPENCLKFWEQILKNQEKKFNVLIEKTLKISVKNGLICFFLTALKFPEHYQNIETHFIQNLLKNITILKANFNEINHQLQTESVDVQDIFYPAFIRQSFLQKNHTFLFLIDSDKFSKYLTMSLNSIELSEFAQIINHMLLTKVSSESFLKFINNIHNEELRKYFCKELMLKCFQKKEKKLLIEYFEKHAQTNFINIFQELTDGELQFICFHLVTQELHQYELIFALLDIIHSPRFYQQLVIESLQNFNITLFKRLEDFAIPEEFAHITHLLDKERLEEIRTLDENHSQYIQTKMNPFAKGFGHIDYEDVLLSMAQKRERAADMDFNPVVIKYPELDDFLNFLVDAPKPLELSFVYCSSHFLSGKIRIEPDQAAQIFILDSLGAEDGQHDNFLSAFSTKFSKHQIFISKEKRQYAEYGCSIFALDDVAQLFKLRIYGHSNLWEYLDFIQNPNSTEPQNGHLESLGYYQVPLPLSLCRTMQSQSLFNEVIGKRTIDEQRFIINNKNQTTEESAQNFFKFRKPTDTKKQNTRLDYKLKKIAEKNWKYLIKHTPEQVENDMQYFTVDTFKNRVKTQERCYAFMSLLPQGA